MKNTFKIYLISFLAVLIPFSVQAFFLDDWFDNLVTTSSVQVINKINVSARTGGNVTGEGEVVEGEATAKVEIENIINGQSIEPVDLEVISDEGDAKVEVSQEITYPDEQGQVSVEREIEINEEEVVESEVPPTPKASAGETEPEPEPEKFSKFSGKLSQWWFGFWGGFKETLASMISFWK